MDEKEREKSRRMANMIAQAQYQYKKWEEKKVEREFDTLFLHEICLPVERVSVMKRVWRRVKKIWK